MLAACNTALTAKMPGRNAVQANEKSRSRCARVSAELKERAVNLVLQGSTQAHVSELLGIGRSTLSRAVGERRKGISMNKRSVGRPPRLTKKEEETLEKSVLQFSGEGIPLARQDLGMLAKFFIEHLPLKRQKQIGFPDNQPGPGYLRRFIKRFPRLKLRTTQSLEESRASAMTTQNLASHFARLEVVMAKFNITEPEQIFNLDETGFSTRDMGWG